MVGTLFFDREDRELLRMINATIDHDVSRDFEQRTFDANLHPHGILELATTHESRMAHAVINLLGSLTAGQAEDRLIALRVLRDEVLHSAQTRFRYNTGRVLIQIMKNIIRSRHDELTQLKLVHDFRKAASGNPRVVRKLLTRNHLLEMPEEWNQLTMDHHVHDANTKGRKNATHLIMDAWVKGIRYVTVVYYNYVEPAAARELLQAAEIMGLSVRIGLEFQARFRGKFVNFVWVPRGFSDAEAFLAFLAEPPMIALMREGRKASLWLQKHVLNTLELWNKKHRLSLEKELEIVLPELDKDAFLAFVGTGQPSFLHLSEFVHKVILDKLVLRAKELEKEAAQAKPERRTELLLLLRRMDRLTPEVIMESWIRPQCNPELPSPFMPDDEPDTPDILKLPPHVLLDWLTCLRSGYRIILQLADLTPEDVLELLWDAQGMITHLELFNLKEWQEGRLQHIEAINALQIAINEGSVLHLKQSIRHMILRLEGSSEEGAAARSEKFRVILRNIPAFQLPYKIAPLRSRIGTDSTSHSSMRYGMGLAIPETLPPGARKLLAQRKRFSPLSLPVHLRLAYRETFLEPEKKTGVLAQLGPFVRRIWGFSTFGLHRTREWRAISAFTHVGDKGNLFTLGGMGGDLTNGLLSSPKTATDFSRWRELAYLNTEFSNILKILIGFLPAMWTFLYTQDWWVLAWFGAPIWFAITGLRNVVQAILAGGGLRKESFLRWTNYVSWSRICDSLMYTGLSVVLLEWVIRFFLLESMFGLSVSNAPFLVFSVIATANSLYIAAHNIYRGFPREAVIGNLFRNVLAIPVSVGYNAFFGELLFWWGVAEPDTFLEAGAAIVSKTASDTVAGLIEGIADRRNNGRLRYWDYKTKLDRLFDCYGKLELAFPDRDMLALLARPGDFVHLMGAEAKPLQVESIIHALDLMYFWMYLPCAQQTLLALLQTMTREERVILARSQGVLIRVREVSQLFVDGLLGTNFARGLSFYLEAHETYINALATSCGHLPRKKRIFHFPFFTKK